MKLPISYNKIHTNLLKYPSEDKVDKPQMYQKSNSFADFLQIEKNKRVISLDLLFG